MREGGAWGGGEGGMRGALLRETSEPLQPPMPHLNQHTRHGSVNEEECT